MLLITSPRRNTQLQWGRQSKRIARSSLTAWTSLDTGLIKVHDLTAREVFGLLSVQSLGGSAQRQVAHKAGTGRHHNMGAVGQMYMCRQQKQNGMRMTAPEGPDQEPHHKKSVLLSHTEMAICATSCTELSDTSTLTSIDMWDLRDACLWTCW